MMTQSTPSARRKEQGMATLVLIILLAIMTILIMAEARALAHLREDIKLVEQHQIKQLANPATNSTAPITTESK